MKTIEINLDKRSVNQLFLPIRSKADVIVLLMNAVKQMLINYAIAHNRRFGTLESICSAPHSSIKRLLNENKYSCRMMAIFYA